MKLAFLCYSCDFCDTMEESPHYPTWSEAREAARDEGWKFRITDGREVHACPGCVDRV